MNFKDALIQPPADEGRTRWLLGNLLVILGFVGILAAPLQFRMAILGAASDASDSLPRKEAYTYDEVQRVVWSVGGRVSSQVAFSIAPAFLLLAGGILLGGFYSRVPNPRAGKPSPNPTL